MQGVPVSAERRRCERCRAEVIVGITELGFDVILDPRELDPAAELAALVAGGRTFTHHTWADAITHRYARVIRERPAMSRPRQAVLAAHRCGQPAPTPRRRRQADLDDGGGVGEHPPF